MVFAYLAGIFQMYLWGKFTIIFIFLVVLAMDVGWWIEYMGFKLFACRVQQPFISGIFYQVYMEFILIRTYHSLPAKISGIFEMLPSESRSVQCLSLQLRDSHSSAFDFSLPFKNMCSFAYDSVETWDSNVHCNVSRSEVPDVILFIDS